MNVFRKILSIYQENHKHVVFASTTFAASLMDSVFTFYYVKVFLVNYKVSEGWFNTAQVLFLIWNMLNDPLFAYAQDHYSMGFNRHRRHIILYGAPIFSLAFVAAWFPWAETTDEITIQVNCIYILLMIIHLCNLMCVSHTLQ